MSVSEDIAAERERMRLRGVDRRVDHHVSAWRTAPTEGEAGWYLVMYVGVGDIASGVRFAVLSDFALVRHWSGAHWTDGIPPHIGGGYERRYLLLDLPRG